MLIKIISPNDIINFIKSLPPFGGSFLQTPWWLEFEHKRGRALDHLGFFVNNKLAGVASVVTFELYGSICYAYCPRGPVLADESKMAEALKLLAGFYKDKVLFVRVEPNLIIKSQIPNPKSQILKLGYKKTDEVQPRATVMLDLEKPEDELLNNMHKKTRYNINLAERKGVKFRWGGLDDFETFWNLLQETAERGKFRTHVLAHYQMLLEGMDKIGRAHV